VTTAELRFTEEQLAEARARLDVIAAEVRLQHKGRELVGLCPFHNEKSPSFTVVPDKGFFHCFGCGAHGDPIGFVMRVRGLTFIDAVIEILGLPPQRPRLAAAAPKPGPAPADRPDSGDDIRAILAGSEEITGRTAAGVYLHMRGLPVRQPCLRAHPALYCHEIRKPLPALVAPLTNSLGAVTAVQRIWLQNRVEFSGGQSPKDNRAPLEARKKTLGVMGDGAVRLRPAGKMLGLAEGVETGIAAMQIDRGVPVWAVCGVSRLGFPAHWRERRSIAGQRPRIWLEKPLGEPAVFVEERPPSIWIPPEVERIRVYGDNGEIGKMVAEFAADWYRRQDYDAEAMLPDPSCDDFNTQWQLMSDAA
jgi:hypothetical protein